MGWFDKPKQSPPAIPTPSSNQPDYTVETVIQLLDTIGQLRLEVRNASMKVLLTRIAWNGEDYLRTRSPKGEPSGADIVKLCKQLETVQRIVTQFHKIETAVDKTPDAEKLLDDGLTSVKSFVAKLSDSGKTVGGNADLTGYAVDTQILSM